MAITKLEDGRWLADIEPIKGKRFRKRFKTKGEAQRFEAMVRSQTTQDPAWNPRPKDRRRLLELIARWKLLHGHALVDVERTDLVLRRMAEALGNPVAADLTGAQYTTYRARRMSSGVSGKTVNNQLGYLRSMFSVLRHLGEIDYPDPLEKVRPLKLQERELSFLSKADIAKVFHSLKHHSRTPHVEMVATICLATGCRWERRKGWSLSVSKPAQFTSSTPSPSAADPYRSRPRWKNASTITSRNTGRSPTAGTASTMR